MEKFKVIFPSGYHIVDSDNDNIDINIILPNKFVYFATLFTILNIQSLMKKEESIYFWATEMIIVGDLKKKTIKEAILGILKDGYLETFFSPIGTIENIYQGKQNYEDMFSEI
jgi:hypothetical protein